MMRISIVVAAAVMASSCTRPNEGNTEADTANVAAPKEIGPKAAALPVDAKGFVAAIASGDAYEIESSKLALQKSSSPGVREMAQMLQREHTQSSAKLKSAAGALSIAVPPELDAEKQAMLDNLKAASGDAFGAEFLNQQRMAHAKTLMLIQNYQAAGDQESLKKFASGLQPMIEFHFDRLNATKK
ncbi:MAG: DUF4142 domain-containing protein [Sphingomicrobium sp.]